MSSNIREKTTSSSLYVGFIVGGAGGNAVNNMIQADLQGVEFAVTNTDAQALEMSLSDRRVLCPP